MKSVLLSLVFIGFILPFSKAQTQQKIEKKNLVIKEWNLNVKTNKQVLDHVTIYGSNGKKIEETEYGLSGQKWRKRYEYGENGKCSKEYVYDERNRLVNYKTFEYNEYGRKKVQKNYDAHGHLTSIKNYEYIISDDE